MRTTPPATVLSASHGSTAAAVAPSRELSMEEVESLVTELVAAYKAPAFQQELASLLADCARARINPLLKMAPVALKAQAPIFEKYRLPQNAQGVDLMKHSVERRVAEGNTRIETLANEARALLGIARMPDRTLSAEHVLVQKVDEVNARLGLHTGGEAVERELRNQCRLRVVADRNNGSLPSSSAACLEALLNDEAGVSAPAVLALLKMAKHGVAVNGLQGRDVPDSVPTLEAPSAEHFFTAQVLPNQPAVLRGVLDEKTFPPLKNFPDTEYLKKLCGGRRVLVKSLAHCDEEGRPVFVSDPELKLQLEAFLESVEQHEKSGSAQPFYLGKVPLRRELPELAEEVERTTKCPKKAYGSCFGALVPDGVFTYFGCGRNTTAVHFDAHENLLLCLCGSKRLFLYPPSAAKYVYPCNDFSRAAIPPFRRIEDLSPDLHSKFSLMQHARPLEVNLAAGDLLYLPSCWWHCVEGSDDRNMILNWWFALHPDKKALAFNATGN